MTSQICPLVHDQHFASATRDTGYRSTSAAVAELIDNAVQAGATEIRVLVSQSGIGKDRRIRLAVWDDGSGMDVGVLQRALQFGGSTRFNDRNGLGRFGMGLPNSSASQARRVDVYTWCSPGRVLRSYLDLDEIACGNLCAVPSPVPSRLPRWAPSARQSGTLVVWTKTDRLDFRKANTIVDKLRLDLGRLFRHVLWRGVAILVNDAGVAPVDPLFIQGQETSECADPYGEPLLYKVKVPGRRRRTALISVRFARLPVEAWANWSVEEKRARGIIGGGGVSIVRASREIAHGWFFLGNKRRQNYDDWWRAEVSFDPRLDELFGVTHSKQGIRPTASLQEMLSPEMERIAHQLSTNVRSAFANTPERRPSAGACRATDRDWRLPRMHLAAGSGQVGQLRYEIQNCDLPTGEFFRWDVEEDKMVMTLNTNHAFFRTVYAKAQQDGLEWLRRDLDCMLLAFARAAEMTDPGAARTLSSAWSDTLATFVGE